MKWGWRLGLAGVVMAVTACGNGDSTDPTLPPIGSGGVVTGTGATETPSTVAVGDGFVSLTVRVAVSGIAETIDLDRATVAEDQRAPLSLDAFCTSLDGGDGYRIAVTDLRRLGTDARLVSAVLTAASGEPGEHDATLELGDAQQMTTAYTGTLVVADDGASGTFELADETGGAATGSFVCADERVAITTTTIPLGDGGEEVPGDSSPPPTAPTLPALPVETVPAATS